MAQNALPLCSMDDVRTFLSTFPTVASEDVSLLEGLEGRILAEDLAAADTVPYMHRANAEGYVVRAEDTVGASAENPLTLQCIGHCSVTHIPQDVLGQGQCMSIVIGAVLPKGANAIVDTAHVKILDATGLQCQRIQIDTAAQPMNKVVPRGEDATFGTCLLPAGTCIRPLDVGLLASSGMHEEEVDLDCLVHGIMRHTVHVQAHKKPQVAIISTGNEVVPVHAEVREGQVRDVNSHTLASLVREAGGMPRFHGIVPDSLEKITDTLERALLSSAHMIIISGGSSASAQDQTLKAMQGLPERHGIEVVCKGIAISPGNPFILAKAHDKTIWAVSGQVTAAQIIMYILGQPFLRHLQGYPNPFKQENPFSFKQCTATMACHMPSELGQEEYLRVRLEIKEDDSIVAHPVLGLSGVLHTMTVSHGLVRIEAEKDSLAKGSTVRVLLFS